MRRSGSFTGDNEASESEKLKIHLPIVSQLFNFWSANKRALSAAPRCQALSELGLSRAAPSVSWTQTDRESRERGSWRWWFYICLTSHYAPSLTDWMLQVPPPRPYADLSICIISIRVAWGCAALLGWLFFVMPETHLDEGIVKAYGRVLSNTSKRSYAQPGFVQLLYTEQSSRPD